MIIQRTDIRAMIWRLLLLVIASSGLIYSAIFRIAHQPTAKADGVPAIPSVSIAKRNVLLTGNEYKAIGEHPLFEPSRQPWSPPQPVFQNASPPHTVPSAPTGYALVGLVLSADQHAALLRDNSGRTRIFREGSTIDGWSLRNIDMLGVHLYLGENVFHMTMHRQTR